MPATPRQAGASVGLPRYAYDPRMRGAKYVDLTTGRVVSNQAITDLMQGVVDGAEKRMGTLGELYADGQISARQFYELMTQEIKLNVNTNTALASGGWGQVTNEQWGMNGWQCRQQYKALRDFILDAEEGRISPAQIVQRAKLYANGGFQRYWELKTDEANKDGTQQERVHTRRDNRVCPECQQAETQGWKPLGTFDVPLHAGCRCEKEFGQPEAATNAR